MAETEGNSFGDNLKLLDQLSLHICIMNPNIYKIPCYIYYWSNSFIWVYIILHFLFYREVKGSTELEQHVFICNVLDEYELVVEIV